jgi:hypothetical protein
VKGIEEGSNSGRQFPVEEVIAGKKEDLTRRSHLSARKKRKQKKKGGRGLRVGSVPVGLVLLGSAQ